MDFLLLLLKEEEEKEELIPEYDNQKLTQVMFQSKRGTLLYCERIPLCIGQRKIFFVFWYGQ